MTSILKKMYSDSSFFNVFGFGGPKIKRIRIRRDIDISQKYKAWEWNFWKAMWFWTSFVDWLLSFDCMSLLKGNDTHNLVAVSFPQDSFTWEVSHAVSLIYLQRAFLQEMSGAIPLHRAFNLKYLMQSHYRELSAGNVSCNFITESFQHEMSRAISLQRASHRTCIMQSHCWELLTWKVSCNLITDSFPQEISHAISLLRAFHRRCFLQSHYWGLSTRNVSCSLITESFPQEMPQVISLHKAFHGKSLLQPHYRHYREFSTENVSCNLITEIFSVTQEIYR